MITSCVIPVHNEAKYLPYSLSALKTLPFDEFIFVLDKCTDNSEAQIRAVGDSRFVIYKKTVHRWHDSCSEAKQQGSTVAKGEAIMMTDADVILDAQSIEEAVRLLEQSPTLELIIFIYRFYTLFSVRERIWDEWLNLFVRITRALKLQPVRYGIYMIRKAKARFVDTVGQYDYFQRNLNCQAISTKTLHLRPKRDKTSQIRRGYSRAKMPQYNLFKMILAAFLQLQPYVLLGYFQGTK